MNRPYTLRLSPTIMERAKKFSRAHGMRLSFFVEKALEEKLENISDIREFDRLYHEKKDAVDFERFLKEIE